MTEVVEMLPIDDRMRFILFGLECALDVEFNPAEVERLFDNAEQDNPTDRDYRFYTGRDISVIGRDDHQETYYVSLYIESRRPIKPSLSEIIERSKYQVYRVKTRMEAELRQYWEPDQVDE